MKKIIYGYHGTSVIAAESILKVGFKQSVNEYDWLGDGVYFFQDAPKMAWSWARRHHRDNASVIKAKINLDDCMDFLDIEWASFLPKMHDAFLKQLKLANKEIPRQTSGAHRLDRSVINYTIGVLAEQNINIRCVRGIFGEGKPLYPNSALLENSHIQIVIRDNMLIDEIWRIDSEEDEK